MNYPVSDMLIRIKNAYRANQKETNVPKSKFNRTLAQVLLKSGFVEKLEEDKGKNLFLLRLKYIKRKPAMTDLKIISRPSLRVYVSKKKISRVLGGLGIAILSTSQGLMTGQEARKKGLGGELLCEVW